MNANNPLDVYNALTKEIMTSEYIKRSSSAFIVANAFLADDSQSLENVNLAKDFLAAKQRLEVNVSNLRNEFIKQGFYFSTKKLAELKLSVESLKVEVEVIKMYINYFDRIDWEVTVLEEKECFDFYGMKGDFAITEQMEMPVNNIYSDGVKVTYVPVEPNLLDYIHSTLEELCNNAFVKLQSFDKSLTDSDLFKYEAMYDFLEYFVSSDDYEMTKQTAKSFRSYMASLLESKEKIEESIELIESNFPEAMLSRENISPKFAALEVNYNFDLFFYNLTKIEDICQPYLHIISTPIKETDKEINMFNNYEF